MSNRSITFSQDHDPAKRAQLREAIRARDLAALHSLLDEEGNYIGATEFDLAKQMLPEGLDVMSEYMRKQFYGYS